MRRALALGILAAGALPLCGAGWRVDAQGDVSAGRMPHLVPTGCGPSSAAMWYGGVGGRVEASPDEPPETRFLLAGEADVRAGSFERFEGGRRALVLFRATPTLGFDSEWVSIMAGGYLTNDTANEEILGSPAGRLRIGPRDTFWISLALFDQPGCYFTQCIAGASYFAVLTDGVLLHNGISAGLNGARMFLRIPFEEDGRWWVVGADVGTYGNDTRGVSFGLTFGLRTPWLM